MYLSKQLPCNFPLDSPAALSLVSVWSPSHQLCQGCAQVGPSLAELLQPRAGTLVLGPVGGGAGGDADGVSWGSTVRVEGQVNNSLDNEDDCMSMYQVIARFSDPG